MELVVPNVLITDDDRVLRDSIGEALKRLGFQVTLASDGEEALGAIRQGAIHLALVDVHMPRVTGLQMMERLRAESYELPLILMSAALDEAIQERAERYRVYRVLSKPIRLGVLEETVSQGLAEYYDWAV